MNTEIDVLETLSRRDQAFLRMLYDILQTDPEAQIKTDDYAMAISTAGLFKKLFPTTQHKVEQAVIQVFVFLKPKLMVSERGYLELTELGQETARRIDLIPQLRELPEAIRLRSQARQRLTTLKPKTQ